MNNPQIKLLKTLFDGIDYQVVEDDEVLSRDDIDEITKALNESLIKELREAGY